MTAPTIISRLAHIALRVPEPRAAAGFYEDVFGLAVVGECSDGLFLATGMSNTFELRFCEGEPAVDHFSLSVRSGEALDLARHRLGEAGAAVNDLDLTGEPGLDRGLETVLPGGYALRLVLESEPRPYNVMAAVPAKHHCGVGPVLLEHITLLCDDVRATTTFLVDVLGLRISDSVQPPGEPWRNTHVRAGVLHHDVGLLLASEPALHHFCFAVPSTAQIVATADSIAARGLELDASIGRHAAGNNIFIYFRDPSGLRVEVNTDMARVDQAAAPKIVTEPLPFDVWRSGRPPALESGTPLRLHRPSAAV